MKTFMEVNPVISDYHSNRMVGKVLNYEQSSYQGVATVLITAEVYKKDGVTLYDKVWAKVVSGEYSGLSMGGASREREPIVKNGRMALELRKLELYEIALCDSPANPFAIIESVNIFAKAVGLDEGMIHEMNGREQIRCTSLVCKFEKGTNVDADKDIDNSLEQFDKPKEDIKKDHIPGMSEEQEYGDKLKISEAGHKSTYSDSSKEKAKKKEDIEKQTVPDPNIKESGVVDKSKEAAKREENTINIGNKDNMYKNDVYDFIKEFGTENVRKALVEIDTIEHLKSILAKYQ